MSISYFLFAFFLLKLNECHLVIKLNRLMSIIKEQDYSLNDFVNQRIDNPYITYIRLGDPSQYVPSFLISDEYSFYLSGYGCPKYTFIYREMSKDFSYITPKQYFDDYEINEYHFLDSLFLEETNNNLNFSIRKIENISLTVNNNMKGPQCFHIGSQVKLKANETGNNLFDMFFNKGYIKSYLYEYQIINDDEIYLNIGININEENIRNYTFIQPISIFEGEYYNNKKWGLKFDEIYLTNYSKVINRDSNAELDINVQCILGNSDFHEYFKEYLRVNNISVEPKIGENEYYFYFFEKNMPGIEIIKNFEISFYYKDLDFNFRLTAEDLLIEKRVGYYFLIAFERKLKPNWTLGYLFFKKYKFIFDFDKEEIGFECQGCKERKDNSDDNSKDNSIKESKFNLKKFFIIFALVIGSIGILILGIFIGKLLYEVRKARVNELLDLYEYKEKENTEITKGDEKII